LALNRNECSVSRPSGLHPQKEPTLPFGSEAGWTSEPVGTIPFLAHVGNRTPVTRPLYWLNYTGFRRSLFEIFRSDSKK